MTQIQKGAVLYCHVDFGVNYSLTDNEKEKPACTQRKSYTCSLWQLMAKAGIDIFSDPLFRCINTDGE